MLNEEINELSFEDVLDVFNFLLRYLRLSKRYLKINLLKIEDELQEHNEEITLLEIEKSINLILKYTNKWFNLYKDTGDILQVKLKEFEMIQEETAYLMDVCYLYGLYIEEIDFKIGCIGGIMCKAIKNGGKFNW